MRIRVRRNWFGRYYVYLDNDNDHLYFGYSIYLIGKGNHLKLYNKGKEQVLYIKEGYIGSFNNMNKTTYVVELIKERINIELKCVDYQNGEWTFDKDQDKYRLNLQRGQTSALFKNEIRIANYVEENSQSIITSSDNDDVLLLTSLLLVFRISND